MCGSVGMKNEVGYYLAAHECKIRLRLIHGSAESPRASLKAKFEQLQTLAYTTLVDHRRKHGSVQVTDASGSKS